MRPFLHRAPSMLAALLPLFFLTACDSALDADPQSDLALAGVFAFNAGERVATSEPVTVYRDPQSPIGTAPALTAGSVLRVKVKNGIEWTEVDFDDAGQIDGFVDAAYLMPAEVIEPPPTPGGDFVVGFLGCSMTRDKGAGLELYSNVESWSKYASDGTKVMTQYSGGTILRWGQPGENGYNNKWNAFEKGLEFWPGTNLILWEICIREEEVTADPADYLDEVQHIAGRIAETAPGVPLYVTGMVGYDPGMTCSITGDTGVPFAAEVAALAVANTQAQEPVGLQLGPLGPDQVIADGCHANASGMEEQAGQIVDWLETLK
ncbi:MAG: hypothetical protein R2834_02350 [Rhodothermales bacterium]